MAGIEDLVQLGNLITQVRGQSKTTTQEGGTTRETTRTDVSEEGINELIRGILAGPGGVQDIGGAARSAGVYDSATEELLLGNLTARAAAQGELARSPTIRETTTPDTVTTTEVPGMGLGPLAGTLAATTLAAPLVESAAGALAGRGGIEGVVSSLFGGGGGGAGGAAAGSAGRAVTGGTAATAGGAASRAATAGTTTAAATGGGASAAGAAGDAISSFLGGPGGGGALSGAAGSAAGGATGAAIPGGFTSQVATGGAGGAFSGAGGGVASAATSFLGGLQGQKLTPVDVGAAIAAGFAAGGPVGAGVAAVGTIAGNLLGGAVDGSVICTALMERGLLDKELYAAGSEYLEELDTATVNGYHYWAVGVADKIRAGSKFWTIACLPFARSRTKLLASPGDPEDHLYHPLGAITKFIGEPICWALGKVLAARERIYG